MESLPPIDRFLLHGHCNSQAETLRLVSMKEIKIPEILSDRSNGGLPVFFHWVAQCDHDWDLQFYSEL